MKRHFCAVWRQAEKSKILVGRTRVKIFNVTTYFALTKISIGKSITPPKRNIVAGSTASLEVKYIFLIMIELSYRAQI